MVLDSDLNKAEDHTDDPLVYFERRFAAYLDLHRQLEYDHTHGHLDHFQKVAANNRYYHWTLMAKIRNLDKAGVVVHSEGYDLKRPHEFFQQYGEYVLRILEMVKLGYSDDITEVPDNPLKLLWSTDTYTTGQSEITFESHVDKAIHYLRSLSPPNYLSGAAPFRPTIEIEGFLDVSDGRKAKADLCRYIDRSQRVSWMCQSHAYQCLDSRSLEALKDFVRRHGGQVDTRMVTIEVKLGSMAEADQFLTVLTDTKHIFNVAVKLNWKATRAYLTRFLLRVADAKVMALELDGITIDIHPEGLVLYAINLFTDVLRRTDLKMVTLLGYPQSDEETIYVDKFALQLKCLPTGSGLHWSDLRSDIHRFYEAYFGPEEMASLSTASKDLLSTLAKHGVSKAASLSIYDDRSLERLTVDTTDPEFDDEMDLIMQLNKGVGMLNIFIPGGKEIYQIGERIVRAWHISQGSLCLSIFERTKDGRGRIVAQVAMKTGRHYNKYLESTPSWIADMDFLFWDCDLIYAPLSDYSTMVLDCAVEQHPTVLKSFALDLTRLSQTGVAFIQNILRRSKLEHLHVVCSTLDPNLVDSIPHLLSSVDWSTLKLLELSGDDIDTWIQLWMTPNNKIFAPDVGSVLQCLTIRGRSAHEFSHAIVLFIHQLVFSSPLELRLENVRLQDQNDWRLIIDAVNDSSAEW
ncbi:hypothetical protein BG000_010084 [Podila horticola]|nr:hypothetical protein BG000_010084 [Podila horticola]